MIRNPGRDSRLSGNDVIKTFVMSCEVLVLYEMHLKWRSKQTLKMSLYIIINFMRKYKQFI